ncbi:TLD-domain-containing protein [Morchella snyderi]|nr:TLD-domain-containing protein [Morchella snyderi]
MGQGQSGKVHQVTAEELSLKLAEKFAQKCFTGVELYSFKDNFRSLADSNNSEDGFLYWNEDTLIRFLSIPDCLQVGSVIFQSTSYLGAFPFPSLSPAILNFEALVKVVTIFTGRYKKVLKRHPDPVKLLFRSLAVYDRGDDGGKRNQISETEFEYYEDDDDDDLSLAALDALDAIEVFGQAEKSNISHSRIPLENLRNFVAFLLVAAPLEPNQPIAVFAERFSTPEALQELRDTAECVIRSFKSRDGKGILYRDFKKTVKESMPFLFDGLSPLFEHLLFSKKVDNSSTAAKEAEPLLPHTGKILDMNLLSQLSLFIKGDNLWWRLRPLYAGSEAGFSMGSFETKVVKWTAPTILLVSGTRVSRTPKTHQQKTFCDTLPPRKYAAGGEVDERVVYGVYMHHPWRVSHRDCFGDSQSILFQLQPTHRTFHASTASTDYAYFNKDDGIGFGSPVQKMKASQRGPYLNLGPVSLTFDPSLEFGVFQHIGHGGAFHTNDTRDEQEWQDVFEIEEIEVWGCGGDSEAEAQRKAWAWEEREALLRRQINFGKDIEADRALLEMAGLIGQNRSGGST